MKIINTNKLIEAVEDVALEPKAHIEVPLAQGAAMKSSEMMKKHFEKVLDDKQKEAKGLDNTEKDRTEPKKIERSEGSKKLHLEESLFESYLDDGDLNHLFFKIINRSHSYELDTDGDLIVTDYNLGDTVGIHLDMLQDYDLDPNIFFSPEDDEEEDDDEDDLDEGVKKEEKSSLTEVRVTAPNFRPTSEEATITYNKIREAEKLNQL